SDDQLEINLNKAIETEQYETAAKIRDEIERRKKRYYHPDAYQIPIDHCKFLSIVCLEGLANHHRQLLVWHKTMVRHTIWRYFFDHGHFCNLYAHTDGYRC